MGVEAAVPASAERRNRLLVVVEVAVVLAVAFRSSPLRPCGSAGNGGIPSVDGSVGTQGAT